MGLSGHPESGPIWDKKMHKCMKQAGFLHVDGSPGFFYNPALDAEMAVYVDDVILIAPPKHEAGIWKSLEGLIEFKDPPVPVERYLGIYRHTKSLPCGTVRMLTM